MLGRLGRDQGIIQEAAKTKLGEQPGRQAPAQTAPPSLSRPQCAHAKIIQLPGMQAEEIT